MSDSRRLFKIKEIDSVYFEICKSIFDTILGSNDEDGFMIPKSKTAPSHDYDLLKFYFEDFLKGEFKPPSEQIIEVAIKIHRLYFSFGGGVSYLNEEEDYGRLKYLNMFKSVHPLFKAIKVKELSKRIDTLFKTKANERIQEGKDMEEKLNVALDIILSATKVASWRSNRLISGKLSLFSYSYLIKDMLDDFFRIFKVTDKIFSCDSSSSHVEEQFRSSIGKKIYQLKPESLVVSEKDNESKEVEFYGEWGREKRVLQNNECLLTIHKTFVKPANVKLSLLGTLNDFVKKGLDRDHNEMSIDTNRLMSGLTIQSNEEHLTEVKEILKDVCVQLLRYSIKEIMLFDRACFWMLRLDLEDTKNIDFDPVTRMVEVLNTSKEFTKLKELKQSLATERKKNKRNRRYRKKERNHEGELKTKFDKLFITVCKTKILNTSNAEVEDSLLSLKQDILKVCLNCSSSDLFKGRTVKKLIDSYKDVTFVVLENLYLPQDTLDKDVQIHTLQGFFALSFFHAYFSDETHDEEVSRVLFERLKRIPQIVEDTTEKESESMHTDETNLPHNSNISNNEKPRYFKWDTALSINLGFEAHMDFKYEFLKNDGTMVYLINRDQFLSKFPEFQLIKEELPEKLVFKMYSYDLLHEHSKHQKVGVRADLYIKQFSVSDINGYDRIKKYNSEVSEEKRIFVPKIFSAGWFKIMDDGKRLDYGRFHITEYIEPTGIQLLELQEKYEKAKDEETKKELERYVQQANKIFLVFDELGIDHELVYYSNFLIQDEKLCVVDFSFSRIKKKPNPQNVDDDNGERKSKNYRRIENLIMKGVM